jgi:hypothetical protein
MPTYVIINKTNNMVTNGIIADDLETAKSFLGQDATLVPSHVYPGCLYDTETDYFVSSAKIDKDGNLYENIAVEE